MTQREHETYNDSTKIDLLLVDKFSCKHVLYNRLKLSFIFTKFKTSGEYGSNFPSPSLHGDFRQREVATISTLPKQPFFTLKFFLALRAYLVSEVVCLKNKEC